MKKRIVALALFIMTGISFSFAGDRINVDQKVLSAFSKDFASAKEVVWQGQKDMYKASFELNGQFLYAYYSTDGQLLAMTRNILSTQLPLGLQTELRKDYGNYWITDLFEMAAGNETVYYITLEDADQSVTLKSYGTGMWTVYKKSKKNLS
jgi:hypothetical protein